MRTVVQDWVYRLRVGFGEQRSLHVRRGDVVHRLANPTPGNALALQRKARFLAEVLGIPFSRETWVAILREVERVRRDTPADKVGRWSSGLGRRLGDDGADRLGNPSPGNALALQSKARLLAEALGTPFGRETWVATLKEVERVRRDTPTMSADGRAAWAGALATSPGRWAPYESVVQLYLSATGGTGIAERLVGAKSAFLQSHTGGPDNEMAAVCLEIAREGPASEAECFEKNADVMNYGRPRMSFQQCLSAFAICACGSAAQA